MATSSRCEEEEGEEEEEEMEDLWREENEVLQWCSESISTPRLNMVNLFFLLVFCSSLRFNLVFATGCQCRRELPSDWTAALHPSLSEAPPQTISTPNVSRRQKFDCSCKIAWRQKRQKKKKDPKKYLNNFQSSQITIEPISLPLRKKRAEPQLRLSALLIK